METVRWPDSRVRPLQTAMRFFPFSQIAFCGMFEYVPRRTRPMQRLIHTGRIARLPAELNRASEWTMSARFR